MGLGLSGGERRREPRLPLQLTAHCQIGGDYERGAVVDLSRNGLGLRTARSFERGTPMRVALALPYTEGPKFCTLSGTVVRSVENQVGMQLDPTVSRGDREVLHGFLALLSMRRQSML
jgi:hypothetical protein